MEKEAKRRRWPARVAIAAVVVLILSLLIVWMAPTLAGLGPIRNAIVGSISSRIAGDVHIDSWSLSWRGPQAVRGVAVVGPDGQNVVSVKSIDAPDVSLVALLRGELDLGIIKLTGVDATVERHEDGTTNIEKAFAASTPSDQPTSSSGAGEATDLSVSVELADGKFTYADAGRDPLVVSGLSAELDAQGGGDRFSIKLAADSDMAKGLKLDVRSDADGIVISDSSLERFEVTPELWRRLTADGHGKPKATLVEPFVVTAEVKKLVLERNGAESAAQLTAIQAEVTVGDIVLDAADARIGRVALRDARLNIEAPRLLEGLNMQLKAVAQQGEHSGTVDVTASIANLLGPGNEVDWDKLSARITAKVGDLPLAVFDQLPAAKGRIVEVLGPTLNADINVEYPTDDGGGIARVDADTKNLEARFGAKLTAAGIEFKPDSGIKLEVSPELAAAFLDTSAESDGADATPRRVEKPVDVKLTVQKLIVPRKDEFWDIAGAQLDAKLTTSDVVIVGDTPGQDPTRMVIGKPTLAVRSGALGREATVDFEATVLESGRIKLEGAVKNALDDRGRFNDHGMTAKAELRIVPWLLPTHKILFVNDVIGGTIGSQLDATIEMAMKPADAPGKQLAWVGVTVKAKNLEVALDGQVDGQHLMLSDRSGMSLVIDPETAQGLFQHLGLAEQGYSLAEQAKVKLRINSLDLPLGGGAMIPGEFALTAAIERLALNTNANGHELALREVTMRLARPAADQATVATLKGKLDHDDQTGDLDADVEVLDLFDNPRFKKVKVSVNSLPVALAEVMAKMPKRLTPVLGDRIDQVTLDVTPSGSHGQTFAARVSSPNLKLNVTGEYVPGSHLALNDGAKVELTATPKSFPTIRALLSDAKNSDTKTPWELVEPASIKMSLSGVKAELPISDPLDFSKVHVAATLACDDLVLRRGEEPQVYRLRAIAADLDATDLRKAVTFKISADLVGPKDEQGEPSVSKILSDTTVTSVLDEKGQLQPVNARIRTKTYVDTVPTDFVATFTGLGDEVVQGLGETVSFDLSGEYPGDLDLLLESPYARVEALSAMGQKRVVRLRADSASTFEVSPELSRSLLQRILPLLRDAASSQSPVKVTIDSKGFVMPLAEFSMKEVKATGTVELGTLVFEDRGAISMLRRLATHSEGQPVATFTPLALKLDEGVLSYSGMVMTIDNVALRFDGRIDQVNNTANLKMGISGRTLGKLNRDLRQVIGPDEYLQVPVRGSIDKLDWHGAVKTMLGQIAKLAARALIKKEVGGIEGQLLDAILGGGKGSGAKKKDQEDKDDDGADKNNADQAEEPNPLGSLFQIIGEVQKERDERKRRKEQKEQQEQQ